jgi:hypothetical protein
VGGVQLFTHTGFFLIAIIARLKIYLQKSFLLHPLEELAVATLMGLPHCTKRHFDSLPNFYLGLHPITFLSNSAQQHLVEITTVLRSSIIKAKIVQAYGFSLVCNH